MATRVLHWSEWTLIAAFAATAAIAGVAAYRTDEAHSAALEAASAREAAATATGKAALVDHWREERLRDGRAALEGSRRFARLWRSIASQPGPAPARVQSWIELLEPHGYPVVLVLNASGTDGRRLDGGSAPVPAEMRAGVRSAFALRRPFLTDIHPGPTSESDLDIIVPLYDEAGAPAAALALPINPAETLYPLLAHAFPYVKADRVALVRSAAGSRQFLSPWPMPEDPSEIVAQAPVPGTDWSIAVRVPRPQAGPRTIPALALETLTALGAAVAIVANRGLRRSRVRRALLTCDAGVLLFNRDEILVAANESAERMLGATPGSLDGRRMRDIVPPSGDQAHRLWSESGGGFETRLQLAGGSAIDVEVRGHATLVDGSRILRMGLCDVSARKRAEQELQAVLETTSDAFCFVDQSGALRLMNDAFCVLVDQPRETLVGAPALAPLGPEILARVAAVRDRGSDQWETTYTRATRGETDLQIDALHLPGPDQIIVHFRDVTARNAAFRKLQESERSLERLVEGATHPIYVFDVPTHSIAFSNRSMQQFLGYPAQTLRNPDFDLVSRLVHPDDIGRRRALSERLFRLEDGEVEEIDIRVRNAAGEWRWMHCRENVLSRTPEGGVRQILGTAEDITDRIRAAEELHERNALLTAAFEAMPVSLVIVAPEGRVLRWNRHAERLFGWTSGEVLGACPPTVPPELLEESRAMLAAVAGGAEIRGREVIRRRKDGARLDVALWAAPVRDRNGETVAIFSAFTDITEEKRYRAELEKSQASLLRAHRMASLGSWESDFRTNRAYWSDGTYQILGLSKGEIEPSLQAYVNAVHPEDRAAFEQRYGTIRSKGGVFRFEHRVIRPDGAVRTVVQWAEVAVDREGVPVAGSGTIQDVTEQRAMEQQLWQAQKLDSVGRIAGGIAHDFNNALTIVNGYADMLARRSDDPRFVASAANEIRAAGRTASDLTTKLLAFSRKQVLAPKPVDLPAVICGMTTLLSGLVGNHIRVSIEAAEQPCVVIADAVQLEQVLMNLALNARDAMPSGGMLRICVRNTGDQVRLTVSDTGVGMSSEVRTRLFEPFFTTKEPGKGTGLGLATVYGIVTQSGGTISVDSAPGRGTAFEIALPAAAESGTVRQHESASGYAV